MDCKQVKKENASHVKGSNHSHLSVSCWVPLNYVSYVESLTAISSSIRTQGPGNYLFKIESFSTFLEALTNTECDKCDSCHFQAGGYKWKLSVYPNGDSKRGGDGYISLYLSLADPKSLPRDEEIHLFFKFFVFDYLLDAYLVLEDGKDRRFHGMNTEWGFAKLLPLEIFNDPSRGYLVDDRCAFGVEMFFHKSEGKRGSSLFVKDDVETDESSFTWKIDKFSTLPKVYQSVVFNVGGHEWILQLYPKGDSSAKGKCVSLYLFLNDHSSVSCGRKVYVEWQLSILDQLNEKHLKKQPLKTGSVMALIQAGAILSSCHYVISRMNQEASWLKTLWFLK